MAAAPIVRRDSEPRRQGHGTCDRLMHISSRDPVATRRRAARRRVAVRAERDPNRVPWGDWTHLLGLRPPSPPGARGTVMEFSPSRYRPATERSWDGN